MKFRIYKFVDIYVFLQVAVWKLRVVYWPHLMVSLIVDPNNGSNHFKYNSQMLGFSFRQAPFLALRLRALFPKYKK